MDFPAMLLARAEKKQIPASRAKPLDAIGLFSPSHFSSRGDYLILSPKRNRSLRSGSAGVPPA
jgi:hypothetical protein